MYNSETANRKSYKINYKDNLLELQYFLYTFPSERLKCKNKIIGICVLDFTKINKFDKKKNKKIKI